MTVSRPARTTLACLLLAALSAPVLPQLPRVPCRRPAAGSTAVRLDPAVPTTGREAVRVVVRAHADAGRGPSRSCAASVGR
jgi:hypothetical protein